jgi:FtsH-binding integral membrane protein
MTTQLLTEQQVRTEQAGFMVKVYGWMALALVITGLVASMTAGQTFLVEIITGNRIVFFGLLLAEIGCVAYLSTVIGNISANKAKLLFLLYSALNGLTFSFLFLIYTADSIASTFFITAGTFGIMSIYGYFTKTDLTTIGNLAFMALIGLIMASVVNYFFQNEILYWITTYAGILIFVVLIAYDTQKIKEMNLIGNEGTEEDEKEAILGALTLYLDFINLFLKLLRIFGKRK